PRPGPRPIAPTRTAAAEPPALAPPRAASAHGWPACPSKADGTSTVLAADAIVASDALVGGKPLTCPAAPDTCRVISPFMRISGIAPHPARRPPTLGRVATASWVLSGVARPPR